MGVVKTYKAAFDVFLEHLVSPFYKVEQTNKITGAALHCAKVVQSDESKSVHVVKDVSGYVDAEASKFADTFNKKAIPQYKGYLVNLNGIPTLEDYLVQQLSRRNRKNLRSKKRSLESSGNISYEFYHGNISKPQYDFLFNSFHALLKKRFEQKKIHNRFLDDWQSLYESVYSLILSKKVYLFVIYDGKTPIAFTLNYILGDVVFSHIQSYDTDYGKYNMGDICMLMNVEWCFQNNIKVYDLAMGRNNYKEKWCNYTYSFEYHIFYRPKSILAWSVANMLFLKYRYVQLLREKQIIGKLVSLDRLKFHWNRNKHKNRKWKAVP